jgi:hypothetical protein
VLSSFVHALSMTLQLATQSGQWGQIRIIGYCDQKVSVLWVGFLCRERANESKTLDTRKSRGCAYECQYFSNESLTFKSRFHVTPIVCI